MKKVLFNDNGIIIMCRSSAMLAAEKSPATKEILLK
jgi:hypothetical protein